MRATVSAAGSELAVGIAFFLGGLLVGALLALAIWILSRRSTAASPHKASRRPVAFGNSDDVPPPGKPLKKQDNVAATAAYPDACQRGQSFHIQVAVHKKGTRVDQELAQAASVRTTRTVGKIRRGTRIRIVLETSGADIAPPERMFEWGGVTRTASFQVTPRPELSSTNLLIDAVIFAGDAYLGSIPISIRLDGAPAAQEQRKAEMRAPTKVFISYSSDDRQAALRVAQAYHALEMDVFQDVWSLRTGEDWEKRLYSEIDKCDCFVLCWSTSAAQSGWVEAETNRALDRRDSSPQKIPRVVAYPLEYPIPKAPPRLKQLHLNDPLFLLSLVPQPIRKSKDRKPDVNGAQPSGPQGDGADQSG